MLYLDHEISNNEWVREFDSNDEDLEWHRDKKDRLIEVIEGENWMFQFDNELPYNINKSNTLFIPKGVYHRLHRGTNKLLIKIKEYSDG